MVDIIDEIINEDKNNKRINILKKILPFVILFTVIGAAIISFISWNNRTKILIQENDSNIFTQVMIEDSTNNQLQILNKKKDKESGGNIANQLTEKQISFLKEIIDDDNSKVAEIAKLRLVINTNNLEDFRNIINNDNVSDITKSYAKILFIINALNQNYSNQDKVKDLNNEIIKENQSAILQYLSSFKDSDLFYNYSLLLKAFYYQQKGDKKEAEKIISEIINSKITSNSIKKQALAILSSLEL